MQSQYILQDRKDGILELLAIQLNAEQGDPGKVELIFLGGGAIVLGIECLKASS